MKRCGIAMVVSVLFLGGCGSSEPAPEWTISDATGHASQAVSVRAKVFVGSCPARESIRSGTATGAVRDETISLDAIGAPRTITGLRGESYCFVATAIDASCRVVAYGQTPANLEIHEHVTTDLDQLVDPPEGGCDGGP